MIKWYFIVGLVFLQFVIVVIAGVILYGIENKNEWAQADLITRRFKNFTDSNLCLSNEDLKTLYYTLKKLLDGGLKYKPSGDYGTSWDYQSSIYTALQVASGVGFGTSSPKTTGGRAFVICYAILGIPIFVVVVFGMGEQLLKVSDWIRRKFWSKANYRDSGWVHLVRSIILVVIGFLIFSVISGGIFCAIDPTLNYGSVLSIISIVFIGPGEFMPGENNDSMFKGWYRLVVGVWSVSSVIYFSGVILTTRRIILIYYTNTGLEIPEKLDEKKNKTQPLSSVVKVSHNNKPDQEKPSPLPLPSSTTFFPNLQTLMNRKSGGPHEIKGYSNSVYVE
ncbi:hypothetical protein HELRODRAFT_193217 [Helobdella robusta]|uniref:Potassium channel domain-containing protein n=1 Tax=Helobdella robusta TaxID=6412 RepID=T1FUR5_HELRO|nr:hypothetical protein HELRODRAFT_193217 [Helobdella robusta]ESN97487.1 hypothetical protein HELRODRAFT_193217 [Helobdella robusta]